MIFRILLVLAAVIAAAALGYNYGAEKADREYIKGMEDAGTIYRLSLIRHMKRIKELEDELEDERDRIIVYACDREICGDKCHDECAHTTDIDHAKNFRKIVENKYAEVI